MSGTTGIVPIGGEQADEITRSKAPRVRSSAYPSYDILYCIEFTKKFYQNFGNTTYAQREEIAKVLGISVGHIQTQISSAGQYGLVDMKVKTGYKPSTKFLSVYKPIDEEEKREALIDCLLAPELYKKLLIQFNNQIIPSAAALSTILFRSHNIAEAASEGAAQIFIKNLRDLNLVNADNHLVLERQISLDENEAEEIEDNKEHTKPPNVHKYHGGEILKAKSSGKAYYNFSGSGPQEESAPKVPEGSYPIPIPLKGGRSATLIIPKEFTGEDLDKITRFIDALRE